MAGNLCRSDEGIFTVPGREFHHITRFVSYRTQGSEVIFSCRTAQGARTEVRIMCLGDGVFRLRMSAKGKVTRKKTAMVVDDSPGRTRFRIKEEDGAVVLATKTARIRVNQDPWQVSVSDRAGRLILEESIYDYAGTVSEGARIVYPLGFSADKNGDHAVFESFTIQPDEHFYGFGEKFSGLDKKEQRIVCWNIEPLLLNTTDWAYKNVPFFMSTRGYGIFINSSHKIVYEMGSRSFISYSFLAEDPLMDFFLFIGDFKTILNEYTEITGKSPVPPKWSFGLWMSKCRYESRKEVEEVTDKLRKLEIPCDVIHLDSAWEKSCLKRTSSAFDYEWDEAAFPSPEEMTEDLREKGFKLSLATCPYVTRETGKVYKEAVKGGYLVRDKKGAFARFSPRPLYDKTYPAKLIEDMTESIRWRFIDFTDPGARRWLDETLGRLLKMGVATFKTDYGELSPLEGVYHNGMDGREMHNLYPLLYNQTVFEIVKKHTGQGMVWGRSGYAGSQRYPITWSGDCQGNFPTMACVLKGGLSYGLSGVPFWSHDIGGFDGQPSPVLYIRWAQFGLLSSHARCHGLTPREPWHFGKKVLRIFRRYAKLRYRLIPYLYSYAFVASRTGLPLMRALVLEYPDDPNVYHIDSEYLLGRELLIAPVFDETNRRNIYLPAGHWLDHWTGKEYEGPANVSYRAPLHILPIFIKEDSIIPLGPEIRYVGEKPCNPLTLDIYIKNRAEFTLYDDKGTLKFTCRKEKNHITLGISASRKEYILCFRNITPPKRVMVARKPIKRHTDEKGWKKARQGWYSDGSITKVRFRAQGRSSGLMTY